MNFFDEDPYAPEATPEDRRATVKREFARLNTTPPESPEQAQRKAKASKERLAAQDKLFGNYPGASIPDAYKVTKPQVEAGDGDGRDD